MSAVILVFDHGYFTKVQSDGTFRLEGIPTGTYQVHFWNEDLDDIIQEVTVPEEGAATLNVEFRK